jgi:hypothetical protein
MKSPWTRAPAAVDPVHETMDLFHVFYNRKIIHKSVETPGSLYFYRKDPIVYFIYVLVPTILPKQP